MFPQSLWPNYPWKCSKLMFTTFLGACNDFKSYSRHVVTKFLSGDGNYRLVHELNGNKHPDDVALTNGASYFVQWADFDAYI